MRYFGQRLDTVPQWETYDWNRFLNETTFLKNFHDQSRCLDSFMNGAHYEKEPGWPATDRKTAPEFAILPSGMKKIQTARDNYRKQSQRMRILPKNWMPGGNWSWISKGLADADIAAIQNPGNFYSFDRLRAGQEIKYRKYLRTEIESAAGKIADMGH